MIISHISIVICVGILIGAIIFLVCKTEDDTGVRMLLATLLIVSLLYAIVSSIVDVGAGHFRDPRELDDHLFYVLEGTMTLKDTEKTIAILKDPENEILAFQFESPINLTNGTVCKVIPISQTNSQCQLSRLQQ